MMRAHASCFLLVCLWNGPWRTPIIWSTVAASYSLHVAILKMPQVSEFLEEETMESWRSWLEQLTVASLTKNPTSVPSLLVAQILPGDIVWLPMGYYFLEKAIGADAITFKVRWLNIPTPTMSVFGATEV